MENDRQRTILDFFLFLMTRLKLVKDNPNYHLVAQKEIIYVQWLLL